MDKKKIVILGSVIFPRNSPRAHRSTELAKEFARQGHDVTLYAVLGDYDYSNFEKEFKVKIKNIGSMKYFHVTSDEVFKSKTTTVKILTLLFGKAFEFPTIELMFKIPKVLKKESNIDLLISIAMPFSIHWGVANFFSKNEKSKKITWVADCGDPFMGNKFTKHPFYFKYIEKWFCRKADYLTIPIDEAKKAYYPEFQDKLKIVPQGFNFKEFSLPDYSINEVPHFIYAGTLYKDKRDPSFFLEYLTKVELDFKFTIYTRNKDLVTPYLEVLKDKLFLKDYITREELLEKMAKADFLVNFENEGSVQSPSKLIDYAMVKRPYISIDSKTLNTGLIDSFLNYDFSDFKDTVDIKKYDIVNVSKQFLKTLTNV